MLKHIVLHTSINVPIDHVWLPVGKKICRFNPCLGDQISFNGWVRQYYKYSPSKADFSLDYCIGKISSLQLIERGKGVDFQSHWGKIAQSGRFVNQWPNEIIAEAL